MMNTIERDVDVKWLIERVNLFDGTLWGCASISVEDIKANKSAGPNTTKPFNMIKNTDKSTDEWRTYHIDRIASLAAGEIDDSLGDWAIKISVDPLCDCVTIEEGRHRVCAAFVRGQARVAVKVLEFEPGDFKKMISS